MLKRFNTCWNISLIYSTFNFVNQIYKWRLQTLISLQHINYDYNRLLFFGFLTKSHLTMYILSATLNLKLDKSKRGLPYIRTSVQKYPTHRYISCRIQFKSFANNLNNISSNLFNGKFFDHSLTRQNIILYL